MTKTSWISTSAATTYVPREKPIQESVAPFSGTISGAAPATTNLGTNSGQRILAADGTWIPQPSFTSGGSDQLETLRPSVITTSYSANPPTVTDSAKAYDSDTNHATTFGQWYAAQEARTNNRVDIFSLTTWASKTQTWTAATINVSRSYAILQDGESSATSGSSSKTSSVKYEFSIDNGSNWTTLGTDTQASIPTAPQTLSMALGTLSPTMGNILVKVTMTRGGGGTIYEDGVSLPGLTGEIDLKLFDVWIDGTYAGGAGNITCNNLTVTGDATFQNKIYDSTASSGTTGQVLKVLSNGKVGWQTDTVGTGTVTSVGISGANGIGVTNSPITTSGTIALSLGAITPTSISTGTGSFSGDVEFAASIKSPNGSNSPIVIAPDGTGDLHVNADSLRLGDNNADATIATNGTGDLILTTHEGSATEGIIRIYDGANGNITLTPNGTGQVQVGSDQVVTLTASQTLTNKTLSSNSVWNGNVIGSAYGGAGTVNGILKANGSGTVSAASAGTDYVATVSVTSPVSNTGTTANPTIALASGYGDTQNPYASKTANYFLASPNGSAGVPTFRAIVAADIPTLNQNTTGTAATASALQTARNINGVSFNGTADITVTAAANTLTGTTLASGVTASSLTSVGTLGSLTVSGNATFDTNTLYVSSANDRVGIGTVSPSSKLHIDGNFLRIDQGGANIGYFGNSADLITAAPAGVAIRFNDNALRFACSSTQIAMFDTNGNFCLGSTSPAAKLDVRPSANNILLFKSASHSTLTGLGAAITFSRGNDGVTDLAAVMGWNNGGLALSAREGITFATGGGVGYSSTSQAMTLDASGNLGIGTSPSLPLHVYNSGAALAYFESTNANGPYVIWRSSGTSIGDVGSGKGISGSGNVTDFMIASRSTYPMILGTNSTERMRITSGGELLIGNTNGTEKLTVTGKIKASDVLLGNNGTKGYGAITTTTSTSTPTGGSSGDHYYIY